MLKGGNDSPLHAVGTQGEQKKLNSEGSEKKKNTEKEVQARGTGNEGPGEEASVTIQPPHHHHGQSFGYHCWLKDIWTCREFGEFTMV